VSRNAASIPERGDAVWISLHPQAGHEQAGCLPALVLSPSAYNGRVGSLLPDHQPSNMNVLRQTGHAERASQTLTPRPREPGIESYIVTQSSLGT
jgi:hypothetical protein